MKIISVFAICLLAAVFPVRAEIVNGRGYVPLASWARANGFGGYTLDRGHEIVVTNRTSRLLFDVDSADANINGVNVRLSFPIAKGALISQLDLDTAVRPLVYPQKNSARRILTICLDPGHGGKDTGNHVGFGFFAYNEKTYTLALALELQRQLQAAGFNVILTRKSDTFVELPVRPDIANRRGADLFISLHFNASPSDPKTVEGVETYCITPVGAASSNAQGEGADHGTTTANRIEDKSLLLAWQLQKTLVRNLGVEDRDVRRARFAVLRDATMPAILIEGGYMTHPVEGKKIFSDAYRKQMATAIMKGIIAYNNMAVPPAASPNTTTNKVSKPKSAK
ncbi:MAG TPA: N-acetylmuramoyl-L-alanine amidase [Candidatus Sulfotelmatobacter sp.]|jgi:N-acetylmuramoyl-L-alanine amidase|nr:N-acetylmuramoyl-L-alanine amidase [Candidatus Sulfotelmatobacter sp.]